MNYQHQGSNTVERQTQHTIELGFPSHFENKCEQLCYLIEMYMYYEVLFTSLSSLNTIGASFFSNGLRPRVFGSWRKKKEH